jgi:hypothetical protein
VDPLPRRLLLASRFLFLLSGPLIAAAVACAVAGVVAAEDIAERLLARLLAEIDAETLAGLPADFLTPATVQRAAFALAAGFALLGLGQLATAAGLRRGARWSYAAAVMGGLFVACTTGATAIFMIAARSAQPQAATLLTVGAIGLGGVAALYGAIAVLAAAGRRDLEVARS